MCLLFDICSLKQFKYQNKWFLLFFKTCTFNYQNLVQLIIILKTKKKLTDLLRLFVQHT